MKTYKLIILIFLISPFIACSGQHSAEVINSDNSGSDIIEAYYFHFKFRCITCITLEERAKENLQTLFPNLVKQGLITFQSVNLDDPASKPLVKRLGVAGQSLLLVKGENKIDLTNEGFMYSMVKPEKFKEIMNEKVAFLLTR